MKCYLVKKADLSRIEIPHNEEDVFEPMVKLLEEHVPDNDVRKTRYNEDWFFEADREWFHFAHVTAMKANGVKNVLVPYADDQDACDSFRGVVMEVMSERAFNTPCSLEERDREWNSLSPGIREMLTPFRADALGIPYVRIGKADIDIALISHAARGNAGIALQFIVSEVVAATEIALAET